MLIRDVFATAIQQRIEPVVKVVDRKPTVLLGELQNLVVTPQWERHLRGMLDLYSEAANRDDESGNGIWVSGFFGSGKSLLVKVLGVLLENPELAGQAAHTLFLERLPPQSSDRAALARYLTLIERRVVTLVVQVELERLVEAGFAKQVGDAYHFLTTQQRSFQDRVRRIQTDLLGNTYQLSQKLKEYASEDALRFDKVPLHQREIAFTFELDGMVVRTPAAHVRLRVLSPFQHALDTQLTHDDVMKQRSSGDGDAVLIRLADVPGLRAMLALALATEDEATRVITSTLTSATEKDIARLAREHDLQSHKAEVRRLVALAVKGAKLFFRGSAYDPTPGEAPGQAVRSTLGQLAVQIYPRAHELPQQIGNEERAIRDALKHVTSNTDLQALNVYRADGTLNDAHALLSTLRARLPIDDGYQQFVQADALRSELERPPFGWDPKAVRVGLALLLRASACRLIDNQRIIADPNDPEVLHLLTKETRFKGLRLQGVKSDLSPKDLQELRGYLEVLFGVKPALVPATLHRELGNGLTQWAEQAQALEHWASTARCPLPPLVNSGAEVVRELLGLTTPAARLPRFREQVQTLIEFQQALQAGESFRNNHGEDFLAVSAFLAHMAYAETGLAAVQRFMSDWHVLVRAQTITEPMRWAELYQAYREGYQALEQQVQSWQQEAATRLAALDAELNQHLLALEVPATHLEAERATLRALFADVQARVAQAKLDYAEARGMKSALTHAELNLPRALADLRAKYHPSPPASYVSAGTICSVRHNSVRRLTWRRCSNACASNSWPRWMGRRR